MIVLFTGLGPVTLLDASVQNYCFWTHIGFHSSVTVAYLLLGHHHTMFGLGLYFLTPFGAE